MRTKIFAAFLLCVACSCAAYAEDYAEGEALAVFRPSEGIRASVEVIGASVSDTYEALSQAGGNVFMRVKSSTKTTEELIAELKQMPGVIAASPNRIHRMPFTASTVTPNDKYYVNLWGMKRIKAPEAWTESTGSDSVYVAVIDSGVYPHPDLRANIAEDLGMFAWSQDTVGHGTHVAGTIGAIGNNGEGIAGINWKVKIIPINVADTQGDVDDNRVVSALNYIVQLIQNGTNIAAVNMSFGGYHSTTPEQEKDDPYYMAYKVFDDLNKALLVVAAGNEGLEVGVPAPFTYPERLMRLQGMSEPMFSRGDYYYPASFTGINNMIVVGATDSDNDAPGFTSWGSSVDIAAPGARIFSTYTPLAEDDDGHTGHMYASLDGTSMAAPHVTGAVALLKAKFPQVSVSDIRNAIISGADKKINPTVYPYSNQISGLDEDDEFDAMLIEALEPYQALNGKGKVSSSGLLNIKEAMDILTLQTGQTGTGNRDDVGNSSSGGCSLSLCGMALAAVFALMSCRKRG